MIMDVFTEERVNYRMNCLNQYIQNAHEAGLLNHIAVRIGKGEHVLSDTFFSADFDINAQTVFDMASITKVMATAMLALIAIDKSLLSLDDNVNKFFPCPPDKQNLTIRNLLTHTIGYGHYPLNIPGNTYSNIQDYILSIPCAVPVGTEVHYSCPGYILLGKIIEKVFAARLDVLFNDLIARPLNMTASGYLTTSKNVVNSNISDKEKGIVNDYNCRFLGGVTGNAGLFSSIEDVTKYVSMLLHRGKPIISKDAFDRAVKNYTAGMSESRGLGFVYVDRKFSQTGQLFPEGSIGHCGHTGQSVFIDLKSGLFVIILSDATITIEKTYGVHLYDKVINMREELHNSILKDLS